MLTLIEKELDKKVQSKEFQKDINHLYALKDRWKHEREYEDFNDYIENAKQNVKSFEIKRMQKTFTIFFTFKNVDLKLKLNKTKFSILEA